MNDTPSVSVTKFVATGLAAVLFLNVLLLIIFKLDGMPVTMGIAVGVAGLLAIWFTKSLGRIPTERERSVFLWCYGGILALAFVALVALASLKSQPSAAGLFILFLHYLPYPAFAQMFFSEKNMTKILSKQP